MQFNTEFKTSDDVEVTIVWTFCSHERGARGKFGEPLEPDESEHLELESCVNADGTAIELTNDDYARAEAAAESLIPD